MLFSTAALVSSLSLASTALASSSSSTHAPNNSKRHAQLKRGSGYQLTTHAAGQDFFDLFNFDDHSSVGGAANFVDQETAWKEELVAVKHNKAHIRVSPSSGGTTRDAVKLVSKQRYSEGLYVFDVERMPQVYGAWPAIWTTGENWPQGGEIDIVEFVSHQTTNAFSVHTGEGCWAGSSGYTGHAMLATQNALNCNADATAAQGCGFRTKRKNTAGIGANANGGGLYVMEWSSAGIKAWMFERDQIPQDLLNKAPNPGSWTTPDMYISASSCDPSTYFTPQQFIVNTELCGTWASGVWNTDNGYAGQEGSCAKDTGFDTCEAYVQSRGWDFKHAYWRIASFSIYNY
ncbi:uncharacterized protein JCM6883_002624 [Sporobolomyces salmoneus]|uniref:uncharacterized protein n=1 Tax=Sporobolomyces salmoneus TaxID=183962 RepID=UPI003176705A